MPGIGFGQVLLVGAGGFLGSGLRFAVAMAIQRLAPSAAFPWGTFTVNVSGCLAIGVVAGLAETTPALRPELALFLSIGVLGGFTTFSTFGLETLMLLRAGRAGMAALYAAGQVFAGLAAAAIGYGLTRWP